MPCPLPRFPVFLVAALIAPPLMAVPAAASAEAPDDSCKRTFIVWKFGLESCPGDVVGPWG